MAIYNIESSRVRAHEHRRRSYDLQNRDDQASATAPLIGLEALASASPAIDQIAAPLPTSAKALAGFVVVVGLLLVGIVVWKVGVWRRRRIHKAASQRFGAIRNEKTLSAFHPLSQEKSTMPVEATWVNPLPLPAPTHCPNKPIKQDYPGVAVYRTSSDDESDRSPPPTYDTVNDVTAKAPAPASNPSARKAVPVNLTIDLLKTGALPSASHPSPLRLSSFGPESAKPTAPATPKRPSTSKKLPRLMMVVSTFTPSLGDELSISLGETIRLLEQYEDEWCLVQRIGKGVVEKGVVPRFCLAEHPEAKGKPVAGSL